MISTLQNLLQKHHKWLFGILLFIIIVAFVFTIGASPGIGRSKTKHMYFHGKDLANGREMNAMAENVIYASLLEAKDISLARGHLDRLILRRIIALDLADEFKIPNPSPANLKKYVATVPGFTDESGKFSPDLYASILETFGRSGNGEGRLKQILCENYRIGEVEAMISGNGIAFDYQIADHLRRLFTEYDFTVATIGSGDIKVDGDIGEVKMENFYKEHADRYAQPQMHAVSMVKFESERFEGKIGTPTDEDLQRFFTENRDSFAENVDFQGEKERIREAYVRAKSMALAYAAAEDFVSELYESNAELNGEKFGEIIGEFGVYAEKIEPYARKKLPHVDGVSATYLSAVCDLGEGRYYTDPCPATFGCVVLFLEGKEDARPLTFDEAKPHIREDIILEKKMAAFTEKIEKIRREVIAFLVAGNDIHKIFDGAGIKYTPYEGVSVANADGKSIDASYKNALMSMGKNDHMRLMALDDDEVLLLAVTRKKIPTNETISKENYEETEAFLKNCYKNFLLDNFFDEAMATIPR